MPGVANSIKEKFFFLSYKYDYLKKSITSKVYQKYEVMELPPVFKYFFLTTFCNTKLKKYIKK